MRDIPFFFPLSYRLRLSRDERFPALICGDDDPFGAARARARANAEGDACSRDRSRTWRTLVSLTYFGCNAHAPREIARGLISLAGADDATRDDADDISHLRQRRFAPRHAIDTAIFAREMLCTPRLCGAGSFFLRFVMRKSPCITLVTDREADINNAPRGSVVRLRFAAV